MTEELPAAMQVELLRSLKGDVADNLLLAPIDEAWQPTDFLPDLSADDWIIDSPAALLGCIK